MLSAKTIVNEVQQRFEGGASLEVNWNVLLRNAIDAALDNVTPKTGKRRVPIYGGISQGVFVYYCPEDVMLPSALYSNDGERNFKYVPPVAFHASNDLDMYTIEYVNGVKFLKIRHEEANKIFTVDEMDTVNFSGDVDVALNELNYLSGSASIEAEFSKDEEKITKAFIGEQDISELMRGITVIPVYLQDAKGIKNIRIRYEKNQFDYYEISSTKDMVGQNLVDGWNIVRFRMEELQSIGGIEPDEINSFSILVDTKEKPQKVLFDRITLQETAPYYLEYFSDKFFVDATTGKWKTTVNYENDDLVNFDNSLKNILFWELSFAVFDGATYDTIDSAQFQIIERKRQDAYLSYYSKYPSGEQPPQYSVKPDLL